MTTRSPEETAAVAESLGRQLQGGEVLALIGDLGAGKTCFVQGLAVGLEIPDEAYVRSPTFSLIEEYDGRLPVYHLDLYRLSEEDELEAIGWRDCLDGESVVAVEWADQLRGYLPNRYIEIRLSIRSPEERELKFVAYGDPPVWWEGWRTTLLRKD
ncbi:MAG: tRNA (adenosine(37)-N6)-threonylcarbamoyltransferase complex ATPase subunit type 1 TsaE [Myxococcales bacterium]|nr:tRNA (adenosine(37)-N6)-threonylcarbamoyltransferase complex ATPase subunit type 1 TsaE [Myxococcales bacterium]